MCDKVKRCPEWVKQGMERMFESYAGYVSRCSAFLLIAAAIVLGLLASGHRYLEPFMKLEFPLLPVVSH